MTKGPDQKGPPESFLRFEAFTRKVLAAGKHPPRKRGDANKQKEGGQHGKEGRPKATP